MLVSLEQFGFNTKFNSDDLSSVDLLSYGEPSIWGPEGLIVEAIISGAKKRFKFPNEQNFFEGEQIEDPTAQQLYNYLLNILNKKK